MRLERIGREPEFSRYMDLKEGWLDRRICCKLHSTS